MAFKRAAYVSTTKTLPTLSRSWAPQLNIPSQVQHHRLLFPGQSNVHPNTPPGLEATPLLKIQHKHSHNQQSYVLVDLFSKFCLIFEQLPRTYAESRSVHQEVRTAMEGGNQGDTFDVESGTYVRALEERCTRLSQYSASLQDLTQYSPWRSCPIPRVGSS